MPRPKYTAQEREAHFWERVNKLGPTIRPELGPCWIWTGAVDSHGYGILTLDAAIWRRKSGKSPIRIRAHKYSWELENGPTPEGKSILHACDNPPCVRPYHLSPGNQTQNMREASARGRIYASKLTPEQIDIIRRLTNGHKTYGMTKYLAEEFGVHRTTIQNAFRHMTYRD